MAAYYLAVDIGASSGRHIIGHMENGKMVLEEIYRFENGMVKKDGELCWEFDRLFKEVVNGLKKCKEIGKIPVSMGVDTWGVDFVLLDKDDNLLKVDADGYCQIDEHMFDKDALIIENRQASKVSLCTPDKKPYLTVSFDAPLFGLWSPAGMGAPFICIEPWYGRCDRAGFAGELKDREYGNSLAQGEKFEKSYTIAIEM